MPPGAYVAYFSMEIGLAPDVPTYAGGLGVLAGDTLRTAADLGVPMVGVSLVHRKGYFHQRLDATGWQIEEPVAWSLDDHLTELATRASVEIEGRTVWIRPWKYEIRGAGGASVSIFLLDTDLPENAPADRTLTHYLYGGDDRYRLHQEIVLGIGGVRMLDALGYTDIDRYHMNEGHSALLVLELLYREARARGHSRPQPEDIEAVRPRCVFTTHTPVPAGHDQFPLEMVEKALEPGMYTCLLEEFCYENRLNPTYLALAASHYVNGVAKKHGEVARHLYARYRVESITNGVHVATWVSAPMRALFDRRVPDWRTDSAGLRYAIGVPLAEIRAAHREAKRALMAYVNRVTNKGFDLDVCTIGYARRATAYKRPTLVFHDIERLRAIARRRPIQLVFAGKAHPRDAAGKELIREVHRAMALLGDGLRVAFLPEYDMALARLLVAGTDLWLNTPQPPLEASGTSGMKAAVNGVPSLSVLDGWWIEGCIEGVTGWAIEGPSAPDDPKGEAASLYDKLEHVILPLYYDQPERYVDVMRHAIALNGSFFNSERMLQQYVTRAYFR
jgi:starch phosphorylase